MQAHTPLEEFYITVPGLPSHTEVMLAVEFDRPRSHRERRTDPLWAVVCLVTGAALSVASGVFLVMTEVLR